MPCSAILTDSDCKDLLFQTIRELFISNKSYYTLISHAFEAVDILAFKDIPLVALLMCRYAAATDSLDNGTRCERELSR